MMQIFGTAYVRRSAVVKRLELLLPLLRLLNRCLLSTFRHCCPPSHVTWRVSHQRASRIDAHCISITTAQRKKQRPHNETCMRRSFYARARTMRAPIVRKILFASMHDAPARAQLQNSKTYDEIRISCACKVCARRASARKIFAPAHFFRARLHVDRACVQSKIILHNLPGAKASQGRNRAKKSNQ